MNFQGTSEENPLLYLLFSYSGVIVWACSELHTISQGRIIVALAASTHWHILTYKFPPVKLVTLPWPWFIDFLFIFLLLLKEEWDVRPVPHISQMQWREVAVTQQASPLNLLWVTCLAYDLCTMTFTHFSVKIHWRRMPLIHTNAVTLTFFGKKKKKKAASRLHHSCFQIIYIFLLYFAECN